MNDRIINVCNRVIFFGLLILVFFLPLVFNPNFQDAFALPKVTFVKVLVLIMVLAWVVKMIEKGTEERKVRLVKSWLNLPVVAFLLISVLTTLHSINPKISLQGMYMYRFAGLSSIIIYVLIYFFAINNVTREEVEKVISAILLGSGIVALYAMLQHFGIDFFKWNRFWQERVWSTFGNPNFLSAYLVMVIPLALSMLMKKQGFWTENHERQRRRTVLLISLLALLFVVLLFSLSRAAWLGFSGSMVIFVILVGKKQLVENKKRLVPLLLLLVLITGISVLYKGKVKSPLVGKAKESIAQVSRLGQGTSAVVERAQSIVELKEYGIATRIMAWKATLKMVKDLPLLGTGLDTFGLNFRKYMSPEYRKIVGTEANPIYPHNEILQIASTMGLIGLGIYLWLLVTFFGKGKGVLKALRDDWQFRDSAAEVENRGFDSNDSSPQESRYLPANDSHILITGLLCACGGLLIQNQFGFSMVTTSVFFWLFMGMVVVLAKEIVESRKYRARAGIQEASFRARDPITGFQENYGMAVKSKITPIRWGVYILISVGTILLLVPSIKYYLADGHFKQGLIAEEKGFYDKAILKIDKAITLNSEESAYHQRLARVHQEIGARVVNREEKMRHFAKAIEEYKKYSKAIPQDAMGYSGLGTAYIYVGRDIDNKFYRFAVENFRKAIEMDPNLLDAYSNLGTVYYLQGKLKQAIEIYNDGLKINPNEPDFYFNLGVLYALEKDNERASRYWRKTLELDPDNVDAKRGLAQIEEIEKGETKR